jgi:hypothetical protein
LERIQGVAQRDLTADQREIAVEARARLDRGSRLPVQRPLPGWRPSQPVFDPRQPEAAAQRAAVMRVMEAVPSPAATSADLMAAVAAALPFMRTLELGALRRSAAIAVPPGRSTVVLRAFCLQRGVPAPAAGSPLRLVAREDVFPVSDRAVRVTNALFEVAARQPADHDVVQALLWHVRHAEETCSATRGQPVVLDGAGRRVATAAGVLAELETVLRDACQEALRRQRTAETRQRLGQVLGGVLGQAGLGGARSMLAPLLDGQSAMREVQALRSAPPVAARLDDPAFGATDFGGVAVGAVDGTGQANEVRATVVNEQPRPIPLPVHDLAGIAVTASQPLALTPAAGAPVAAVDAAAEAEAERVLDPLLKLIGGKVAGLIDGAVLRGPLVERLVHSPVLRAMLRATPGIGTALSAYEAWTGRDWFSGETLGGFERSLAFLGALPGPTQALRALPWRQAASALSRPSSLQAWSAAYQVTRGAGQRLGEWNDYAGAALAVAPVLAEPLRVAAAAVTAPGGPPGVQAITAAVRSWT